MNNAFSSIWPVMEYRTETTLMIVLYFPYTHSLSLYANVVFVKNSLIYNFFQCCIVQRPKARADSDLQALAFQHYTFALLGFANLKHHLDANKECRTCRHQK